MDKQSTMVPIAHTVRELALVLEGWRRSGLRIALVPTMGALHAGHLELVRAAATRAERTVVSIFVNPAQFAPHEDFTRYPRNLEMDRLALEKAGTADLIYAPETGEIYPDGYATHIVIDGPARGLESDVRPHFFSGVATIVAKLFVQCRPDVAMFGEKDYQQLLVVRRLSIDLDLGTEIIAVPIVREADGLALSSRNAYLGKEQRRIAGMLNRVLDSVSARVRAGMSIPQAEAEGAAGLISAGFDRVDYVAIRDSQTLAPVRQISRPARVLSAARIGDVRLIDNKPILPD
jgi:pantoate--beta-alanine ligase